MHISEDHFIAEIIDPKTGEVLPEGEVGELVITALTKEALPVLRYRTKDMTVITSYSIHYTKLYDILIFESPITYLFTYSENSAHLLNDLIVV